MFAVEFLPAKSSIQFLHCLAEFQMDCCSRFCTCCCPCCYNKDEVPYKNPRDAYAAVITPDTPPTGPMTKTVKMQQPPSSIQSSAKEVRTYTQIYAYEFICRSKM